MLLFGRSRILNPARSREAIAFAVEVANRAREVIGQDVFAWTTFASPETGMILWSARFDSLNDVEVAADKLSVANEYMDYVEQHDGLFIGPTVDALTQVVAGTPDSSPMSYISIVRATCQLGKLSDAMAAGAGIAEAVTRITGRSCLFGASLTGSYGGLGWITGAPDAGALSEAWATWAADADATAMVERIGELLEPGTDIAYLRRLA
jgi:hypothetical protein